MARYLSAEHDGVITRKESLNPNKKKKKKQNCRTPGMGHCARLETSSAEY